MPMIPTINADDSILTPNKTMANIWTVYGLVNYRSGFALTSEPFFSFYPYICPSKKSIRIMKQISIAILLCLCTLAGFAQGGQALDLKDIVSGKFRAENIYGVIPIPGDGEHYSQMNAEGTQIIKYSFKTGKQVEVLFDAATARECPFKKFDSYSFSPDGSKLLIATETET